MKDRQSKQKEENSHDEKTKYDQTNIQKAGKIHNLLNQRLIKQLHLLKRIWRRKIEGIYMTYKLLFEVLNQLYKCYYSQSKQKGIKYYFILKVTFHQAKNATILTDPPVSFRLSQTSQWFIWKKKTKKTFKNTESLVYSIQTKDLYDDMLKDQDLFDFAFLAKISNWEMKDELNGLKMKEFVGLRAKTYSASYKWVRWKRRRVWRNV